MWGGRPAALLEPQPQDRVERHHGEHIDEICPLVPILDVPVPQMGAQVVEFMHAIDTAIPEQVMEVPRLSPDRIPQRSLDRRPQSAEQLVEVPTEHFYVYLVVASKFPYAATDYLHSVGGPFRVFRAEHRHSSSSGAAGPGEFKSEFNNSGRGAERQSSSSWRS